MPSIETMNSTQANANLDGNANARASLKKALKIDTNIHTENTDVKKEKKHRFRKLFRKDKDSDSSKHQSPAVASTPQTPEPLKRTSSQLKRPHHNSNPFVTSHSPNSPYGVLGTGSDIAAPRNGNVSRQGTFNNGHTQTKIPPATPFADSKNPSRQASRIASQQSITGSIIGSKEEEKNILPLPMKDPNDVLPEKFKQETTELYDKYAFDDRKDSPILGTGGSAIVVAIMQKYKVEEPDREGVMETKTHIDSFALKKFRLLDKEQPDKFYERCLNEFLIAKDLTSNTHVIKTYELMRTPTMKGVNRGWGFVLESCTGGDLFSVMERTGWKNVPLEERYCLFKQTCYGVRYIHSQGYAHRDLKPENILLDERGVVKITDFGVTIKVEPPKEGEEPKKFTSVVGSAPYMPPEVEAFRNPLHKGSYDPFKIDMWSMGIILLNLVYCCSPFQHASPTDSQYRDYVLSYTGYCQSHPAFLKGEKVNGPGIEYKWAREFKNPGGSRMAWRLADPNENTRYTIEDVFNDPWIHSFETCCKEDGQEEEQHNHLANIGTSNNNSRTNSRHNLNPSPQILPKTKSMLDFSGKGFEPANAEIISPTMPPIDAATDSQQSFTALPPLEEHAECDTAPSSPLKAMKSQSPEDSDEGLSFKPISPIANPGSEAIPKQSFQRQTSSSSVISSLSIANNGRSGSSSSLKGRPVHNHVHISNVSNHGGPGILVSSKKR